MRDFLKGLELDSEVIDSIMAEHGKLVSRDKEDIGKLQTQIKAFSDGNTNYEELYSKSKSLQDFVNKRTVEATKAEVQKALEKQRLITEARLSEEEAERKLQGDDLVAYKLRKAEEREKQANRVMKQYELKGLADELFNDLKAPSALKDLVLSISESEDSLRDYALKFSEYEYYPKGALEKAVADKEAEIKNALTKQAPPESRGAVTTSNDAYGDKFAQAVGLKPKPKRR
jgi:hypothetical protein